MLTTAGRAVVVLAVALLIFGWILRYVELVALGLSMAVLLAIAAVWMLSRPRITSEREVRPNRVIEGNPATGILTVTNNARRRSPAMVALERFGDSSVPVAVPSLEPGSTHTRPYRLPTDRRGVFEVGPLVVSRSDPFGLMQIGQDQRSVETLWVHPATHDMTPFPSGRARDLEGPTSGEAPQGGIAFHTLREYVRGDDLRLIHWRSSAKSGKLMVRHNVDTNQPRSLVVLDTQESLYGEESFEEAVRVAASIVMASAMNNFPVRVRTTCGLAMGAERGVRPDAVLDQLSSLTTSPDANLRAITRQVASERGGFSLAVLTGQASATELAAVGPMRARFDTVTIGRLGVSGRGTVHELPGAVLINAETSVDFALAWNRRVRR